MPNKLTERVELLQSLGYSLRRIAWVSGFARRTLTRDTHQPETIKRFLEATQPYTKLRIGEPK